jgi:hypothetical protein
MSTFKTLKLVSGVVPCAYDAVKYWHCWSGGASCQNFERYIHSVLDSSYSAILPSSPLPPNSPLGWNVEVLIEVKVPPLAPLKTKVDRRR